MHIEFPEVNVKIEGMDDIHIPPMVHIRQLYDKQYIADIPTHVEKTLGALPETDLRGKRICITAGSRGIPHMALLYRSVCSFLKKKGAHPFLVPAIGSHGGATDEGQKIMLAQYGLTEESVGAPIISNMDVVEYGRLSNGSPLYCDKNAAQADGIIIMHKVKPHTDFRANHESGLAKMIAIGIAKHKGATEFHRIGFEHFATCLPEAANIFINTFNVVWAIGVVQNAYDEICAIEAAPGKELLELDKSLLILAKQRIAQFKFKQVDVLIIDQIGKEISGFGADPNVIGRTNGIQSDFDEILKMNKLFIAGLTETTHHNGAGIAAADITTRRCLNDIEWSSTWTNIITSSRIRGAAIPMYLNNDHEAIRLAMRSCTGINPNKVRMARIRNTLEMNDILVSPALYAELENRSDVELISPAQEMPFDENGFMLPF